MKNTRDVNNVYIIDNPRIQGVRTVGFHMPCFQQEGIDKEITKFGFIEDKAVATSKAFESGELI